MTFERQQIELAIISYNRLSDVVNLPHIFSAVGWNRVVERGN